MKEFYAFQNAAGTRNAFLANQTEKAYQTRSGGDWGLSLGDRAKDLMLDHVGWSFIPLYRLFGPLSMLLILVIFVVGLVRLVATLLIRKVIITKKKIVKAKEEAKPIYKMAQELFRKDQSPSAPKGAADMDAV